MPRRGKPGTEVTSLLQKGLKGGKRQACARTIGLLGKKGKERYLYEKGKEARKKGEGVALSKTCWLRI